ncbi:MAG: hypothetical protein A2Y69_15080 [Candidatus Aminicenantes bacterium RBG_13_59_9]|jgi:hypothetical protein|nr:MAG: hypothetical protein A2Y69_15080 [Candidatus Aminicenantes bacterium RBG_13_59_9]
MTRKEFLRFSIAGIAAGSALSLWPGCSSSEQTTPPPAGGTFSSSNVQGHSHSVTLQRSEVENPPSDGISRETSSNSGHSHTFAMTQAELQSVNGGTTVTVTDSSVQAHSHTYQIQKWF